jgi:parvulin-like peptidyl-prolyl isomerase
MKSLLPPLLAISLLLSGCSTSVDPEKVLVTVNGTHIREKQVLAEADKRIDADAARAANSGLIYDESERNVTRAFMRDEVLHTLIERQLIADQLKADRIGITDAEVDACFLARAGERGQTAAEAEAEIKKQGKTLPDVKERLRWHTLGVQKLYEAHAQDKRDTTEAEALRIYNESPAEYAQEQERRVSRLLINAPPDAPDAVRKTARAKADASLKRIKAGEDFAAVAKACSEDGATKDRGGDRGWSKRGFVTAPGNDPFGDVAFAMKNIGDVSEVVETLDGYEIIKLTGIKEARQRSFDEVKGQIIGRNKYWEIGNFWEQYAAEMHRRARIDWDPKELARKLKREKDAQEYNEKVAKQVTPDQKTPQEPAAKENPESETRPAPASSTEPPRAGPPNAGPR